MKGQVISRKRVISSPASGQLLPLCRPDEVQLSDWQWVFWVSWVGRREVAAVIPNQALLIREVVPVYAFSLFAAPGQASVSRRLSDQCFSTPEDSGRMTLPSSKGKRLGSLLNEQGHSDY